MSEMSEMSEILGYRKMSKKCLRRIITEMSSNEL